MSEIPDKKNICLRPGVRMSAPILADDPFRSIRPIAASVAVLSAAGVIFLTLARSGIVLRPDLITIVSIVIFVVLLLAAAALALAMKRLATRAAENPDNVSFFEPWVENEDRREEELGLMLTTLRLVTGNAVLLAISQAGGGALLTGILVAPLVESLAVWLDSPGARLRDGMDGLLGTVVSIILPAGLLIFSLLLVRPWRSPLGLSTRLLAAFAVTFSLLHVDPFLRAEPRDVALILFTFILAALVICALDALWVANLQIMTMGKVPIPDVRRLQWARERPFDHTSDGRTSVGIAMSGGGYRASLFALGALLYVHDALADRSRRVVAISSVSGGSVTNAVLAQGGGLEQDGRSFDELARVLVDHATGQGSMFAGLRAQSYYFLLLPGVALIAIALFAYALTHLTLSTWGHAVSLLLVFTCVAYGNSRVCELLAREAMRATSAVDLDDPLAAKLPSGAKRVAILGNLFGLAVTAVCLVPLLSVEWRQGLALIAGVVCAIGVVAFVWSLRGP
jgi:hypothetical protein